MFSLFNGTKIISFRTGACSQATRANKPRFSYHVHACSFGDVYRHHVDRWPKMPRRIHRHRWQLVMSKQEAFIPNRDKFQRNDSWNKQTKSSLEWFLYVFTHCANRVPFYPRRRHSWPSQLEAKVVVTIVKKLVLFGSKIMQSLKINKNALAYSATTLAATMMNSVFNFYYVKTFLNVYK